MNTLNEFLFQDLAYELDDYISSTPNPANEYRTKIIPFFITAFKYFNSILNTQEKIFLSNIETIWNTPGSIDTHTLEKIRKDVSNYKKSLPIDNVIHRYLASGLERLTYQFISESEVEVSLIWLYLSSLIRASISCSWLYNNLIKRYSQYLSDKVVNLSNTEDLQ